jgi:hypothetical protein
MEERSKAQIFASGRYRRLTYRTAIGTGVLHPATQSTVWSSHN